MLDPSIFTERVEARRAFYLKHNRIGDVELGEWNEVERVVYELRDKEVLLLREKGKHEQLVLAVEAIQAYWFDNFIHLINLSKAPQGLRISYNGTKRLFPLEIQDETGISLLDIDSKILSHMPNIGLSELIYMLTGWIS